MRNFDLAPLYRATVGFDQIADLMDRVFASDLPPPPYPPYNIEKTAENAYRIAGSPHARSSGASRWPIMSA